MSHDLFFRRRHRRYLQKRVLLVSTLLVFGLLLVHNSCRSVEPPPPLTTLRDEPVVTVKISAEREPTISIAAEYQIFRGEPKAERGPLVAHGSRLGSSKVRTSGGMIYLGETELQGWIEIVPAVDGAITVGKHGYRGSMFLGASEGKLLVVNKLPMERYLQGVLGAEMPLGWHESALQAQAIAARTYALYEVTETPRSRYFDLYDSQQSQVYNGTTRENDRAREMISRSRGVVMTWIDRPFKAFFHSTCGGRTADVIGVFPEHAITPLSGRACQVADAALCERSSVFRWTLQLTTSDLAARLTKGAKQTVRMIHDVRAVRPSGKRVQSVVVIHEGGRLEIPADRFRWIIGPGRNGLLSTDFAVEVKGDQAVFRGRGWGHGVGLCQFGAQGLAGTGATPSEIARFYYPGADVVKLWD